MIKMFQSFFFLLGVQHFAACLWLVTARLHAEDEDSWMEVWEMEAATITEKFIDANFWAVATMTSIGFGDIIPGTYKEKVSALFVMILGASMYGDLFGTFVAIIELQNEI